MLGLWLAWVGCDGLTPCEEAALVDAPTLEIGMGEDGFAGPLADGDTVSVDYGSQGGQHLWLAVHTTGFAPGEKRGLLRPDALVPAFFATLYAADGTELATQAWQYEAMEGTASDASIALGEFVVTGVTSGQGPYLLAVEGEDACGNTLAGDVSIEIEGLWDFSTYSY